MDNQTMSIKNRWQPTSCQIPRVLFVGDLLSLNQWQSLTCMIHKSRPEAKYNLVKIGGLSELKFLEYDVSIMLSRNAFLVDIVLEGS
ncbi:hypothetical protein DVH24_006079 [Malus domestica]|uniref:Trichome birefringence-like C-terminal domain-containing protein n=1 Tax=Malus domestica TaxID=3750 RepID=A0A498J6N1_MALDO|nr:hypothetical protein DVH24_006079 [Malus domestica]